MLSIILPIPITTCYPLPPHCPYQPSFVFISTYGIPHPQLHTYPIRPLLHRRSKTPIIHVSCSPQLLLRISCVLATSLQFTAARTPMLSKYHAVVTRSAFISLLPPTYHPLIPLDPDSSSGAHLCLPSFIHHSFTIRSLARPSLSPLFTPVSDFSSHLQCHT